MSTPLFAEVLTALVDSRINGIRVALPASVQSYDPTTQRADVQPLIQDGYYDSTNTRIVERLPVITDVPIVFPGSGGFRVTFPVAAGDVVLLVFSSSSLDRWLASSGAEVDPVDDRRHHISDAIAIPGLRAAPLGNATPGTMSMGQDGGPTIEISGSTINAGGSNALMLVSDFMNHVHVAPSGGGPTATPTVTVTGTAVLKGG